MHEIVKKFIDKKKEEQEKLKKKHLDELDLFDTEDATANDYDIVKYENGVAHYYKKVPIEVTDEEYAEICKYAMSTNALQNVVSKVFYGTAIVIWILGTILSLVLAEQTVPSIDYLESGETTFSWGIFLFGVFATFISGMIFLGFSEIIKLLQKIVNK